MLQVLLISYINTNKYNLSGFSILLKVKEVIVIFLII